MKKKNQTNNKKMKHKRPAEDIYAQSGLEAMLEDQIWDFYLHDTWLLPLDLEVSLQAMGVKSGKFWQQVCEGQGKIHSSRQTLPRDGKQGEERRKKEME